MEQFEIFKIPPIDKKRQNPMLKIGVGPEGKRCKTCKYLIKKQYSNTYYKCHFRGNTNGPGTDHRINWQACSYYEE